MFKINNKDTRATLNFEYTSHMILVFLLLTLNRWMPAGLRVMVLIIVSHVYSAIYQYLNQRIAERKCSF